ncbi:hypothetical protein Z945_3317 [Sulfitobacter noctilucae]|uniref:hypothetical protein n=1 Tax=Sulfitobacter noctilucae TaxID=1342302 RepID=UPI000469BBE1|nr:hypothetical protein [Sulfitobacter noctilucae]KIN70853.1 hypothetical protein Z945_3317 [Sulfitobacter noctilucae]
MPQHFYGPDPSDAARLRALADLRQATALVETAAFDLAERIPSHLVADLMMAAAQIDRLAAKISPTSGHTN